jgi:hypothetical protein
MHSTMRDLNLEAAAVAKAEQDEAAKGAPSA